MYTSKLGVSEDPVPPVSLPPTVGWADISTNKMGFRKSAGSSPAADIGYPQTLRYPMPSALPSAAEIARLSGPQHHSLGGFTDWLRRNKISVAAGSAIAVGTVAVLAKSGGGPSPTSNPGSSKSGSKSVSKSPKAPRKPKRP